MDKNKIYSPFVANYTFLSTFGSEDFLQYFKY